MRRRGSGVRLARVGEGREGQTDGAAGGLFQALQRRLSEAAWIAHPVLVTFDPNPGPLLSLGVEQLPVVGRGQRSLWAEERGWPEVAIH